jgi:hypothetical protein
VTRIVPSPRPGRSSDHPSGPLSGRSLGRLGGIVALGVALGALAACGGSNDPGTGALGSTVGPTPSTPAATPSSTPTHARATRTTSPAKPTSSPGQGGDGDSVGDNQPATAGGGICRYVGADQVGAVLGVTVSGSAVPGETGCKFDQGGKRGASVTILDKSTAQAGGMDGAKSEATSAVEGTPQDLGGIGSAAFVVTGTMFGGPDTQGAGAVASGGRIISVYLVQRSGMSAATVRTIEVDLLKLVAQARS